MYTFKECPVAAGLGLEPYSTLGSFVRLGSADVLLEIDAGTQLPAHRTVIAMFSNVLHHALESTKAMEQVGILNNNKTSDQNK